MSTALAHKEWSYVKGLGKVEVMQDRSEYDALEWVKKQIKEIRPSRMSLIPLMLAPFVPIKAFAAEPYGMTQVAFEGVTMHEKMMSAFAPIIELVQSLAYPVALLVVLGGGLFVMVGNSDKGFSMIQRAALGYVLVMMLPMLLDVLAGAMSSVV